MSLSERPREARRPHHARPSRTLRPPRPKPGRQGGWRGALLAAALWLGGTRAAASTVTEPIARLTLEGGWDSNALYDGKGGDNMGRVSPDLGLLAKDHLWSLRGSYGGDFLVYQHRASRGVWNQRGGLTLRAQPDPRVKLFGDFKGSYAVDPIGLARLGVFTPGRRPALILQGSARATWEAAPLLDLSATWAMREARFDDGTGASTQAPGLEASARLTPRTSLGGAYRFDFFLSATAPKLATAHELKAIYRYQLEEELELVAEAGPTLWRGQSGPTILPEGSLTLVAESRRRAFRASARHGLSLGSLPTPGVTDGLEAGGTTQLGDDFRLKGSAGLWRGGSAPFGSNAVVGYAADAEVSWLVTHETGIGLGVSRFARLDDPSPNLRRTVVGLRFTWELQNR